ncbi:MAG: AMP-binding protein, partial [Ilumatobacteraceae bacterium]
MTLAELPAARERPFWRLVEQRADATPDHPMCVDEDGRAMTFGQYRDTAERVAAGLADRGIGPGSVVTWQLPSCIEAVVLIAALARLGAVQNPVIPILRQREVQFIATELGTDLLVVPGVWRGFDYPAMARDIAATVGCDVFVSEVPAGSAADVALPLGDPATLPAFVDNTERPLRWVYYTSGTTADPKGVRHTDRSIVSTSVHLLAGLQMDRDDVTVMVSPITHIGGVMTVVAQLLDMFKVVLMRAFDERRTPELCAEHDLTVLRSPVPVVRAFVTAQLAHGPEPLFPRLRACQAGGAARPLDLHIQVQKVFGLRGTISSYGMTECPGVTACAPDDTDEHLSETSGRIVPDSDIAVIGADGERCGPGVEGELRVRGPQLFTSYVDDALNAGAIDEHGYFRSGDLGTIDEDGYVRVTGRLKDIIIRNGENISALEIENVLGTHDAIADIAVIGVPDERTGERCCAVVQLVDGAGPIGLRELAELCEQHGLAKQK